MFCDFRTTPRQFTVEFIEMYKARPSLWKVGSPEYKNREWKKLGYKELLDKLKSFDPSVDNVDMVKKRINSLRTCYRKEERKVTTAALRGEQYVPALWYYEHLTFLNESARETDDDVSVDMYSFGNDDENCVMQASIDSPRSSLTEEKPIISNLPQIDACSSYVNHHVNKRRKELNESLTDYPHRRLKVTEEDDFDAFGMTIAKKMRTIDDKYVKLHVEKLINDVLYEAQMGTLTTKHKLINTSNSKTVENQREMKY